MDRYTEGITEIVYSAIEFLNEELAGKETLKPQCETILIGPDSDLSSLQIINLVVRVEDEITIFSGVDINLTDDESIFNPDGPLRTVKAFIDYLKNEVDNK